jgi:hypothetical protein
MASVYKAPVPKRPRKSKSEALTTELLKDDALHTIPAPPPVPTLDGYVSQADLPRLLAQPEPQPENTKQEQTPKRKQSSPAAWYAHKKSVVIANPDMSAVEQLILAKKTYEPNGTRQRSAQAIHREAFLLRNPNHNLDPAALSRAIRLDLLSRI